MTEYGCRARQSGAILLVVALLLATMAAIAFGLNQAAGADGRAVLDDHRRRAAGYLAEAAVATARWSNQVAGCRSNPVATTAFAGGTFEAEVQKVSSKRLNITATGRIGADTRQVLTRLNQDIADFTRTQQTEVGGAALDTTLDAADPARNNLNDGSLALAAGTSYALMYYPLTELNDEWRVLDAKLQLTNNLNGSARVVGVHRMQRAWDGSATWWVARQLVLPWSGTGFGSADYGATPVDTRTISGNGTAAWTITELVDGWVSGRLANYGLLLPLEDAGQPVRFYSRDASSQRPVLTITAAKPC